MRQHRRVPPSSDQDLFYCPCLAKSGLLDSSHLSTRDKKVSPRINRFSCFVRPGFIYSSMPSSRALANVARITKRIRARRAARTIQRVYRRRRRGARLFRRPRAGGRALVVPLKCGYQYVLAGTGTSSVPLDNDVSLANMPSTWFTRYGPQWQHIRINKVRIEITCPYNIGQHGVGTQSLYKVWSKRAFSTAETPPTDLQEWMNMQNARRSTFRGAHNAVNYYFTPGYESNAQPLNTPVTQLCLHYKRWTSMPTATAQCIPHIGMIAHIVRTDGSIIDSTNKFNVNVTLYCQVRGLVQL